MKNWRLRRLLVLGAIAAVLGFVFVSALFAWRFTTATRRPHAARPEEFLATYEAVNFTARDGVKLSGWFVSRANAKRAVVLLHGFGSTRTQCLARARFFSDRGYAVLLYDARGHGLSEGDMVSFGWYETRDLLGALDWLRSKGFTDFGLLGISQGGATIALAAADLPDTRWVVLESVYPSLPNAVDRRFRRMFFVPGWLAGALMVPLAEWRLGVKAASVAPADTIATMKCPVFIMAGETDEHTLPADARKIFERAREPKSWWLVPGAAHVDLYGFAKADYEKLLVAFLERAGG